MSHLTLLGLASVGLLGFTSGGLLGIAFGGIFWTAIGLGALIFIHELGHFLACRLTGTRVEAFSIGFGPELFGWTRGGTRYRLAAIPLGGYVKMAAENPGDARSDAPDEFPNKSFSARLFIMANGVIFNIILAFILFVGAFGLGVSFERPEVGQIEPGSPAWKAGLQQGDVIERIGGGPILSFTDVITEVAFSGADEALAFTIRRGDETLEVPVRPRYSKERGMPMIGIGPAFEPGLRVEDGAFKKAGGRDGDVPLAVAGRAVDSQPEFLRVLTRVTGTAPPDAESIPVQIRVRGTDGKERDLTVEVPLVRRQLGIVPHGGTKLTAVRGELGDLLRAGDVVEHIGGEPIRDLNILSRLPVRTVQRIGVKREGRSVGLQLPRAMTTREIARLLHVDHDMKGAAVTPAPGLAAERAGVQAGDRIVSVAGKKIKSWSDLQSAVAATKGKTVEVELQRGEETVKVLIEPGRFPGKLGIIQPPKNSLHKETGVGAVLGLGWRRTVLFMKQVTLTIRSLVTRRVSAKHVGGPIALATVTYRMFDQGWGRYFYILAILSINLAVLNLLPIPILDGGQIVLLCAEKIRGKPLPDRVVGYLQLVGLLMILALMVLAFSNDIARLLS